jgi:sec-independent protein translocase protein TatB
MFNVGGGEILVILVIALIVLGPQRLPDAARQIGKTMGDLRRLSTGFQNEVRGALDTADDPNRVAARRNVLARDTPLVAEPDAGAAEASGDAADASPVSAPPKVRPPSAQARAAAKKQATKKAAPAKKATKKSS